MPAPAAAATRAVRSRPTARMITAVRVMTWLAVAALAAGGMARPKRAAS